MGKQKLSYSVLSNIRQSLGLESDDNSKDEEIYAMDKETQWHLFLQ